MKKITIVTPYFAPAWAYGGPPVVLNNIALSLTKKGYDVNVITTDANSEKRNSIPFEEKDGVKIYRFRNISNTLAYKYKLFIIPSLFNKTKDILNKSDVVLFSDLRTIINWQLYSYIAKRKIPYGIFAYGQIPYDAGLKAFMKKVFDKVWIKDFVQKASYRFAQTDHEVEMYREYFKIPIDKIQILPLPVIEENIRLDARKLSDFRKKHKIQVSDRILLFVGRLNYLKGIDLLIDAVIPLLRKNSDLRLMIVGRDDGVESDLRSQVPSDLKDRIIFTGPLYGEDAVLAFKSATCFVFTPRYYEETSVAALQALSYGVPVIVTKQSDIPGILQYGAGLVIKNTSATITEAVITLLGSDKSNKIRIKKHCISLIHDVYRSEKVTDNLLNYIQNDR